jgi:site-specific recombinase XerD
MEITFYQKTDQPDPDGRLMIHCRVCWQGTKVRFSTKEKVRPAEFDSNKEEVRNRVQFATHINQTLSTYKSNLSTFYYNRQNSGLVTVESDIRAEIDRIRIELLGQKKPEIVAPAIIIEPQGPSLADFHKTYTQEMKANRSPEWAKSVRAVNKQLQDFRPGLEWVDLRVNTLNLFKVFLQEEAELSDNTIHSYISLLRGMCEYAERSGVSLPRDYSWIESKPTEVIRPHLEPEDEQKIRDVTLEQVPRQRMGDPDYLENIRWYFLLACATGLRRSDQWQFLNPQIQHIENTPCLMVLQQKTGNRVAIPLESDAYHLLKNPISDRKPPITDLYNRSLKEVGEQAKLTRLVTVGSFYKGELIADVFPFHKVLSSHLARHTFATRMTQGGLDTYTLKELMGHKSVTSTQRYQSTTNAAIVQNTIEVWRKQLLRKKP